jgi:hypothetical protein
VDVVKGASGLLKGAGNPGAVVNLARKRHLPLFFSDGRPTHFPTPLNPAAPALLEQRQHQPVCRPEACV